MAAMTTPLAQHDTPQPSSPSAPAQTEAPVLDGPPFPGLSRYPQPAAHNGAPVTVGKDAEGTTRHRMRKAGSQRDLRFKSNRVPANPCRRLPSCQHRTEIGSPQYVIDSDAVIGQRKGALRQRIGTPRSVVSPSMIRHRRAESTRGKWESSTPATVSLGQSATPKFSPTTTKCESSTGDCTAIGLPSEPVPTQQPTTKR